MQLNKLEAAQSKKQMGSGSGQAPGPLQVHDIPTNTPFNPMAPKHKNTLGGPAQSEALPVTVSFLLS
jgi:hypothetical protein